MRRQTPFERAKAALDTIAADATSARGFAEKLARDVAPVRKSVPANDNDGPDGRHPPRWVAWSPQGASAPLLVPGPAQPRRANKFFAERRPEFLLTRRCGELHALTIHDEREIVAPE